MRTNIYIDGFNFYYSVIKGTSYKWLDFNALFLKILDPKKHQIQEIKYFTALVDGKQDPAKPIRQDAYLRALQSHIPHIKIYHGHFLTHPVWRRLVKPTKKSKYAQVYRREEKGSDVNLAIHLLNDAWLNAYDCAIIVSNDSDLTEALRIVREDQKKVIGWLVYDRVAVGDYHRSKEISKYVHFTKHLAKNKLMNSQLPEKIPGTKIVKPKEWY
jgi:uncharacterized LabA/DUF88 family protein